MSPQVGRYLLANSIGRQGKVGMPFRCRVGPWRRLEQHLGGERGVAGSGGLRCNELHVVEFFCKKAWKPRFCWIRRSSHRDT